jgi:hypothetical protein
MFIQDGAFRLFPDARTLSDSNTNDLDLLMNASLRAKKKDRGGGLEREGSNLSIESGGLNRGWSLRSWESMASEDLKQEVERGLSHMSLEFNS